MIYYVLVYIFYTNKCIHHVYQGELYQWGLEERINIPSQLLQYIAQ